MWLQPVPAAFYLAPDASETMRGFMVAARRIGGAPGGIPRWVSWQAISPMLRQAAKAGRAGFASSVRWSRCCGMPA